MGKFNVPDKITTRNEFWSGFGKKEAVITAIITAVTAFFAYLYVQYKGAESTFIAVFSVLVVIGICISLLSKIENNLSIVDYIAMMIDFNRRQQKFYYQTKEAAIYYVEEESLRKNTNSTGIC